MYLIKGMIFPGWFSKLDSPGRLFSPVGFNRNRFHYWTYIFLYLMKGTIFFLFKCSPAGFKGTRFHYWTYCVFVFDERNFFLLCCPVGFKGNRFHYWTYVYFFQGAFKKGTFLFCPILISPVGFKHWTYVGFLLVGYFSLLVLKQSHVNFSPVGFKRNRIFYWRYYSRQPSLESRLTRVILDGRNLGRL